MEALATLDSRPARRKFSKPPVKVACLSCRTLRIRCDGQNPCTNCIAKNANCFYVPSRRGGPRNCQNRKRRKAPASIPVSVATVPGPEPAVQENDRSDTHATDTEERRSQQSSSFEGGVEQTTSGSLSGSGFSSEIGSDDADWFHQLMDLSEPGAGLRNVEMPIAEIESIFDSIFAGEQGGTEVPDANVHFPMVDLVQIYGSYGDILDAYYIFIHPYYPALPPPERLPVYNRPLRQKSTFHPSSPLSLAIAALLVLIPHPDEKDPSRPEYVKLRRDTAHSFAQAALEAVEVDSELVASSSDPSSALSEGVPQLDRDPFHPFVPVCLESVLALLLLSVYEYAQRGNINKMRNRAGQALTTAMSISLHETVEEDEFAEAKRRAWWMTYMAVCQGSIVSSVPPVFNVYDPRFVTPYPESWKFLIEAQQTILEATTFVHDLDQAAKTPYNASWIPQRMQELDSQITSLLLLCKPSQSSSMPQTPVVGLDSPEVAALKAMGYIAEIKLQSARIKTHRFNAFKDIPIFRRRHCDLEPLRAPTPAQSPITPSCCRMKIPPISSIPSPENSISNSSSISSSMPSIRFPFSSHVSSKICLHAALSIVTLLDNLPYPNPTNEIPWTIPPYLSWNSRVEIPRTMPTFACCAMQSGYALLMLCFKARAFNRYNRSGGGSRAVDSPTANASAGIGGNGSPSLNGFMNELQQNLRLVVRCLGNYSIAFEAMQGMRDEILGAVERGFGEA
ncbi:transcription factor domain-containing protein [Aspergillus chevalieri]|uniref:Zn(2)-C6 fungal-type domain-containing protein n=1 Tax=Aspergillus chevalieri TaxID=182096 RepID=A0A7R7VPH1_ASPCH|nr:uncharacterized protein ACHE_41005S [Aspergillus chevalieri]BCR88441.1 hypothetical protein ACHE_41005S [Aspergillus chevalieri]